MAWWLWALVCGGSIAAGMLIGALLLRLWFAYEFARFFGG